MPEISSKSKIGFYSLIGIILIAANILCYSREFQREIKLRDYTAAEQLLYHPDFTEEGYAPDALIREIVRGKTVLVPRDVKQYSEYGSYGDMHDEGNPFSISYFSENNYTKYFSEYADEISVDRSLPDLYELEIKPLPDSVSGQFTDLGRGHEMMRYAFLGDHTDEEVTNQFFYTYYYTTDDYYQRPDALNIYVCTDRIAEDPVLAAVWDTNENLFLMSRAFYDEQLRNIYGNEIDTDTLDLDAVYNGHISGVRDE